MSIIVKGMEKPEKCEDCRCICSCGDGWRCGLVITNSRRRGYSLDELYNTCPIEEPVDIGYLHDWYQSSVYGEPVWTDEHIKELVHDFYLIPKQENDCATYSTHQWIPCSERLPKKGEEILLCDMDGTIHLTHLVENKVFFDRLGDKIKNIRAWMPLPEPYTKEVE